jgi:HD-GYP domain-containing protein (c-di-GMP phosphodiesterase class II)
MFYNLSDQILDSYEYAEDDMLKKKLHAWDRVYIDAMLSYDSGISGFGKQMMAHQNRVAKNGRDFLLYLGYSQRAAQNFRAAMLFHDLGKTHGSYSKKYEMLEHPHFAIRHAVTLYHHERNDRKGPEKENLQNLPVFVQVSCLVDTFDGDRIKRPHQESQRTPKQAIERMLGYHGQDKYSGAFPLTLTQKFAKFIAQKYSFTLH